jgi:hypothetical protein
MASEFDPRFVRRLRWSLALLLVGVAVETSTLLQARPFTFLTFMFVGTGLVLAGTAAFLWVWLTR